jgi:Sec-independent protein translocase protein TatA
MRNIIALSLLLIFGPASARDWQDTLSDAAREGRDRAEQKRLLNELETQRMMNQIEQADQARRLDRIERQNRYIQDDLDAIRRR